MYYVKLNMSDGTTRDMQIVNEDKDLDVIVENYKASLCHHDVELEDGTIQFAEPEVVSYERV